MTSQINCLSKKNSLEEFKLQRNESTIQHDEEIKVPSSSRLSIQNNDMTVPLNRGNDEVGIANKDMRSIK